MTKKISTCLSKQYIENYPHKSLKYKYNNQYTLDVVFPQLVVKASIPLRKCTPLHFSMGNTCLIPNDFFVMTRNILTANDSYPKKSSTIL